MFERFTDRARRVIVLTQEEARLLNHNYIGTEHLLLGMIHEAEGVAGQVLAGAGVELNPMRKTVEEIIGQGQQAPSGHIPFTPRARRVLDLSLRTALQLGHNYIATEHLLLGMIYEGEGVGCQALRMHGVQFDPLTNAVLEIIAPPPPPPPEAPLTTAGFPHTTAGDVAQAKAMIEFYTKQLSEAEAKQAREEEQKQREAWEAENSALGARESASHETRQKLFDLVSEACELRDRMARVLDGTNAFIERLRELPEKSSD